MANAGVDFAVAWGANSTTIPSSNVLQWGVSYYMSHTPNGRIKKGKLRVAQGVSQLQQVHSFLTIEELRAFAATLKKLRAQLAQLEADSTIDWWQKRVEANSLAKACANFYNNTVATSTECAERQLNAMADVLSERERTERARAVLEFNAEQAGALEQLESLTSDPNNQAALSQGSQSTSISDSRSQAECSTPADTLRFTNQMSGDPLGVTAPVPQNPFPSIMAPPPAYMSNGSSRKSSMPEAIMRKDIQRP